MKKSLLIFIQAFRHSRLSLILAATAGAVLCLLSGLFMGLENNNWGGISAGFIDADGSAVSADFRSYLSERLQMDLHEQDDLDFLKTELIEKHISVIILVPEGFEASLLSGAPKPIETIYSDDYENVAFTQGYLDAYAASLSGLTAAADGETRMLHTLLAEAETKGIDVQLAEDDSGFRKQQQFEESFRAIAGFYLTFAFLLAILLVNTLFSDRTNGRFDRIRLTGVRPLSYIVGTCAHSFLCLLIMLVPFTVFTAVINPTILPIGRVLPFFALCVLFTLFVIAFGLCVGLFLNSRSAIIACVVGVATVTSLIGGAWFHLTLAPGFMRTLAHGMPQFWFMDAIDTLLESSEGFGSEPAVSMIILALYALFFFILAGVRFADGRRMQRV